MNSLIKATAFFAKATIAILLCWTIIGAFTVPLLAYSAQCEEPSISEEVAQETPVQEELQPKEITSAETSPRQSTKPTLAPELDMEMSSVEDSLPEVPFPRDAEEEYIWRLFATTMYFEAAPNASYEGIAAVGWVIKNRMADPVWGDTTYEGTIYRRDPVQFAVILLEEFEPMVANILSVSETNKKAALCLEVARDLMTGGTRGKLPETVQFFYGDPNKRTWGKHTYYQTIEGNSFFHR